MTSHFQIHLEYFDFILLTGPFMIIQKVLRTLFLASFVCLVGCGGGGDSASDSSANSSSSGTEDSADPGDDYNGTEMVDEQMSEEEMSGEHGSGSDEASMAEAMADGNLDMAGEHGAPGDPSAEYNGTEEEMQAQMDAAYNGESATGGGPRKPPRPEKIEEWTPEQIVDAIREADTKVIKVIELHAEKTVGQAAGVEQLKTWLTALSEKPQANTASNNSSSTEESLYEDPSMQEYGSGGGYGRNAGPSKKQQISEALLEAFATNGTKPAFQTLSSILSGQLEVGEDKNKSMEMAFVTLMKNVSAPSNPARDQLLKAMTAVELDGAEVKKQKDDENAVESLQKRVKELHLGFAIASMNGLIGAKGQLPGKQNNQYDSMYSGSNDAAEMSMEPGSGAGPAGQGGPPRSARPVKVAPIDLDHAAALRTLSYLWSDQMVAYAVKQLEKHPESVEAFIYAASFPVPATRAAVRKVLKEHRLESPRGWLHDTVLTTQLADPAIHLLIKEFPREARPGSSQGGEGPTSGNSRSANSRKKDDDPNAKRRKEASYDWKDASEKSLVSLMQRMYEGSQRPEAEPYDPSGVPVSVHKGAEVTASLRFALPDPNQASKEMSAAEQTIVNYVRIESNQMNNKTVLHYRNSMRDKTVFQILGGNGMWLDGPVKPYRKNGTLRSVDVVLSKGGARPPIKRMNNQRQMQNSQEYSGEEIYANTGGNGGGNSFVVEILTVEIPPEILEEEAEKVTANK